jgi:RimJ/RimL family protein N-acetyltransferase
MEEWSPMLILDTKRLLLRPLRDADVEPFAAYRSDPEVARYQGWDAPYSMEQAAAFIDEMKHKQPAVRGEWYQLAIELKAGSELIGDCAFHILAADGQQADIGITLARRHQGRGYATEAATRLLDYLFHDLGLHRVGAICDVENLASARLLERLGMRREGHFVENVWFKGRWGSEYLYALVQEEWLQKTRGTPVRVERRP